MDAAWDVKARGVDVPDGGLDDGFIFANVRLFQEERSLVLLTACYLIRSYHWTMNMTFTTAEVELQMRKQNDG